MTDIVAIAYIGDFDAAECAATLAEGEEICQRLAGVMHIAEGVDDRDTARGGHFGEGDMLKDAWDDAADPAFEVFAVIVDAFTLAKALRAVIHVDAVTAEFGDADLEADAGAERGLLEEEDAGFALQSGVVIGGILLHRDSKIEYGLHFRRGELCEREEVPSGKAFDDLGADLWCWSFLRLLCHLEIYQFNVMRMPCERN